jgi:hypothetical protein
MVIEVLGRDARVVCVMGICALCEKPHSLHRIEVWKGPGQKVVVCEACFAALEEILGAKEAA